LILRSPITTTFSIEVFKTDIENATQAAALVRLVESQFSGTVANVDLHDCDKVLRVKGRNLEEDAISRVVQCAGFFCRPLE
jgi:hypothetical protein